MTANMFRSVTPSHSVGILIFGNDIFESFHLFKRVKE